MRPTIYTVERAGAGRLSTMAKPRGLDWLPDEMQGLRECGVDVVVSALPIDEADHLGLAGEHAAATAAGLTYVALPIADLEVPAYDTALPVLNQLAGRLDRGEHIVAHCRFGIGRSSLIAAALLVLTGSLPDDAWQAISDARGRQVPDTVWQCDWVASLPERAQRSTNWTKSDGE